MANPASIKPVDLPKIELDDDGLIDEDSLLTEEDRKRPDLPVAVTIPSKPPCKKLEMCGFGDAFRCSACPVKGIPPFILDEKIWLDSNQSFSPTAVLLISPISSGIVTLKDAKKRMLFVALCVLLRVSLVWKQAIRYICRPSSVNQTARLVGAVCGMKFWRYLCTRAHTEVRFLAATGSATLIHVPTLRIQARPISLDMEKDRPKKLLMLYATQTGNAVEAAERVGREAERQRLLPGPPPFHEQVRRWLLSSRGGQRNCGGRC
ncbi:anamorsin-like protein [Pyrus ussuriensis x Pyrus communis]|uniref:Anamorsin-like protein n=1 Tax=Pyrus ussuriensis x Pyrus communis TaxID=2448454 RepID=A0A5N5HSQ2_9ROSA|nr:anamorsin-like protein [Pyrus ussuriensis x Pyrus communis]